MCARSQTSGLISAEWAGLDVGVREAGDERSGVRSRASVSSAAALVAAWRGCVAAIAGTLPKRAARLVKA